MRRTTQDLMVNCRIISLLVLICALSSSAGAQLSNEEILSRATDESAASTPERQRVLAVLLSAASQARDAGDNAKAAGFFNRAARLQIRLSLANEALATFQEALALAKRANNPTVQVDSMNGVAAALANLSKCDRSEDFTRQAIELSDKNRYVAGKATALLTLSDCQNYREQEVAIETAKQALELSQSIDDKRGMARAYTSLADYQLTRHYLAEATRNNLAAVELWRELNLPGEQAEPLISLGFIEYRKGDWESCLSLLTQAQSLFDEAAEPFKMGQIAAAVGEAFIENGMPETGLAKLQQAAEYFRLANNKRSMIGMEWDIGRTQYLLGNYSDALSMLRQGLRDAESIQDSSIIALCHEYLGRVFEMSSDDATALQHYQTAIDLYTKNGRQREAARTNALLGKLYEKRGQTAKAREFYRTALAAFYAIEDRVNQAATLYALGRLELKQNELEAAEAHLRQSIEVTEEVRRVSSSRDLTTAFSATVHDRYQSYIECLMRKSKREPAQRFDLQALQISEVSRGRALAELLRATQTNLVPGIAPELAEQEKLLRQSLRMLEDDKLTLLATQYKKEKLDELQGRIASLEIEFQKLSESIKARYPAYGQITRPTAWDLKQIQKQLIGDNDTALLEYSLGPESSYVWVVTATSVTSHELEPEANIEKAAKTVYELLNRPPVSGNQTVDAIQKLGAMILDPVLAEIKDRRRLIIVADGALHFIPFQVLSAPWNKNEPLVTKYEIVNAPSASILGQLQEEALRRHSPDKLLAAFGNPVFASNYAQFRNPDSVDNLASAKAPDDYRWRSAFRDLEPDGETVDVSNIQPLFYAQRELSNLRDVGGDSTFIATGFDASREKLEHMKLDGYAIVHFATHGILNSKRPENSGLLLSTVGPDGRARDGFLRLSDVYQMHIPVNLVVLSACRTGLGKDVRGEGLIGLTRGFMYAGASSVVASLWKVDDEATAELMKLFYTNMLRGGMRPTEALRSAQNTIRQNPNWNSPYYWAAFTLQGDFRESIQPRHAEVGSTRSLIIIAIGLLILFVGMYLSHRRMWANLTTTQP